MRTRGVAVFVVGLVAGAAIAGGAAVAVGSSGSVTICANKKTGAARVANKCTKAERAVAIAKQGIPGPAGASGPAGADGASGPPGVGTQAAGGDLTGKYPAPHIAPPPAPATIAPDGGGDCSVGAFCNGWSTFASPYPPAAYYRDRSGYVHFVGALYESAATSTTVMVLPVGYRPASRVVLPAVTEHPAVENGFVQVDVDGTVTVNDQSATFISLEAVTFLAAS